MIVKKEKDLPLTTWLILILFAGILMISPYKFGLFNGDGLQFSIPIYSTIIVIAITLGIASIALFRHFDYRDVRHQFMILVWTVPLAYQISSYFYVTYNQAKIAVLIHLAYAALFIASLYVAQRIKGLYILSAVVIISCYFIMLFGWLNWFGNFFYQDGVLVRGDILRISSVFQYPNTYAAFLLGVLFACITLMLLFENRKTLFYSNGFLLVPITLSFLLTNSRGGLITLPVAFILIILFFQIRQQFKIIVYLLASIALSALLYTPINEIGLDIIKNGANIQVSLKGWAFLLLPSLVFAYLARLLSRWINNANIKWPYKAPKASNFLLPLVAVSISAIVLLLINSSVVELFPLQIKNKIDSFSFNQHSFIERAMFYRDAMSLFRDHLYFGVGGGGWSTLYEKYQSFPYLSRQTHSFIIQYFIEVGLVGTFLIFAFLFTAYAVYIYNHIRLKESDDSSGLRLVFAVIPIPILIHSMIDFDISFVFVTSLIFISLGLMLSGIKLKMKITLLKFKDAYVNRAFSIFVALVSVLLLYYSAIQYKSATLTREAEQLTQQQVSIDIILAQLDKSIDASVNNFNIRLKSYLLVEGFNQTNDNKYYEEAKNSLDLLKKFEPNNRYGIDLRYSLLLINKEYEEASKLLEDALAIFPWDMNLYERAITLAFQIGNENFNQSDIHEQYWNKALNYYKTINQQQRKIAEAPDSLLQIGKPFKVPQTVILPIGQIQFINKQYKLAEEILNTGVYMELDQDIDQQIARWYLASLQKQGKQNDGLYKLLIEKDPTEQEEIEKILNIN